MLLGQVLHQTSLVMLALGNWWELMLIHVQVTPSWSEFLNRWNNKSLLTLRCQYAWNKLFCMTLFFDHFWGQFWMASLKGGAKILLSLPHPVLYCLSDLPARALSFPCCCAVNHTNWGKGRRLSLVSPWGCSWHCIQLYTWKVTETLSFTLLNNWPSPAN